MLGSGVLTIWNNITSGGEEEFVRRRRDFGSECRIAGQFIGLRSVGQQRMHRMPPLMRVSGQPVIFVAEVEQQIGVNVERARLHVGA